MTRPEAIRAMMETILHILSKDGAIYRQRRPRGSDATFRLDRRCPDSAVVHARRDAAVKRVAAVETAKNEISRDFRCSSIFDFFQQYRPEPDAHGLVAK